jgi:hexosaminidase
MQLWKLLNDIIFKKMKKTIVLLLTILSVITCKAQLTKDNLSLMPWPQEVVLGKTMFFIDKNFTISVSDKTNKRIEIATTKFLRRISGRTGVFIDNGFAFKNSEIKNASLEISFKRTGKLEINEDESYQLKVAENKITIKATTDIGVIYALETLLQLTTNNDENYYFPEVTINDNPRFTWRGLMIDVARHFQPVNVIKRNLDAMTSVKMNVLHWHLTDDQGFRVESKTHPKLHQLGSDGQYYTQNQIKEIVQYASNRGVRVVPEFDVPGHATAILTAYPEIASKDTIYSIERFSGVFNPTLDPTNEKTYQILADLFGEMSLLFPDKYFHIGGDENEGKHWNENENIQAFKKEHQLDTNHDLQTYFNIRLEQILKKHDKSLMGWEEIMTQNMPTTALIHAWKGVNENVLAGQSLINAPKKGYNTILSNGYYVDLMQPVSQHYLVDPIPKNNSLTTTEKSRILGGEASMWSELVTSLNIDSRLWPRTAAIAERFWSSEKITDIQSMYKRMEHVSFRLEELGISHIRNRNVILRNITNNQNIESLKTLADVCEPLKIYTRNKGGTEYKTFSPFTLFVDACTADAPDSFIFKIALKNYFEKATNKHLEELISFFNMWISNYKQFKALKKNPILNTLEPLYANLALISIAYKDALQNNGLSKDQLQEVNKLLQKLKEPVADVELSVYKDFEKLFNFLFKN